MKKVLTLLFALAVTAVAFAQPAHYLTFNGTDQYMRVPHHDDFNIAADQSFTVTGWVRNEVYTDAPRYICKRDISVSGAGNERTGYEFCGTGNAGQNSSAPRSGAETPACALGIPGGTRYSLLSRGI